MTRRQALALLGAAIPVRAAARPVPALCLFSGCVQQLEYSDFPPIIKQLGFDGIDLTVRPGGHVEPRLSNVDMVRAIEEVRGHQMELPVITTALTSPYDPTVLPVIAIAGHTQVPLFIPGFFRPDGLNYRRDIGGLISIGMRYGMAIALHNHTSENAGEAKWDAVDTVATYDPKWAGLYFDPIHHGEKWEAELQRHLPRLRAVALKDFKMVEQQAKPCPMGQGLVDWDRFFKILADAKFYGPLSLRLEYKFNDALGSIRKDGDFVRKKRDGAYIDSASGSGSDS